VLGRMFKLKRLGATESLSKLHNEEHHNLYSSTTVSTRIKLRTVNWPGNVASMKKR
jgi:hypothetical protein